MNQKLWSIFFCLFLLATCNRSIVEIAKKKQAIDFDVSTIIAKADIFLEQALHKK